jgi:hypothetical protein
VTGSLITLPRMAVTEVLPSASASHRPSLPASGEKSATTLLELIQVTTLVRSAVLLSEYVPVALNCCVVPKGSVGLAGETEMVCRATSVTVAVAGSLSTS